MAQAEWDDLLAARAQDRPIDPVRLHKAVAQGVPATVRASCWMKFSGAAEMKAAHVGLFQKLIDGQAKFANSSRTTTRDMAQIETDLRRSGGGDEAQLRSLRRVLQALCAYLPSTAYVQGQNFITAGLLRELGEEDAFWRAARATRPRLNPLSISPERQPPLPRCGHRLLVVTVEAYLPDHYSPRMAGSMRD